MGVTLGSVLANVFGGPIAQMQGADVGSWLSGIGLGWLFGGWTGQISRVAIALSQSACQG